MTAYALAVSQFELPVKLQSGDPQWPAFNASFVNHELSATDIQDVVYAGWSITTQLKAPWRTTENYLRGQHIGLDFDTEDERSTLATLAQDRFISKYGSFVHTTRSHTEEKPRARVVFLLDQPIYQGKNYALAATALIWLFGSADRQCKDCVRFFYGAQYQEQVPIGNVLPLEVVQRLIGQYQETGQREKRARTGASYLPPADQSEVAEALRSIPPWQIDYDDWVAVLMALHAEFGEAGLPLAESWADGKEGEVVQKWRSFKPTGNEAGRIGIGSLFAIANRHGWTRR